MKSLFDLGPLASGSWPGLALDISLKTTLVLAVAALASLALRRASASVRHLCWALAVTGTLAMPLLTLALPAWRLPILPAAGPVRPPVVAASPLPTPPGAETYRRPPIVERPVESPPVDSVPPGIKDVSRLGATQKPASRPAKSASAWSWSGWMAAVWACGAAGVVGSMIVGRARLRMLRSRSRPLADGTCAELAGQIGSRLGLSRRVVWLRGEEAASPMTWGVLQPVILMPATAEDWPRERLRAVMLHELAHVKRWDCLTQLLAGLSCAIYWFHPLAWLAARRLMVERELACDDLVLGSGSPASDYARHLLEVVRISRPAPGFAAAVPMARPSHMEGRLLAILDRSRSRRVVQPRAAALMLAVAAALVIPLSAARLGARTVGDAGQGAEAKEEAPAAREAMMTVSGRVLDSEGKPVPKAEVGVVGRRKLAALNARSDDQNKALGRTVADAEGRFQLEVPRTSSVSHYEVMVLAASPGLARGWAELNRDAESPTAEVTLRPEQIVEGRLVDLQGTPAPGVQVRVSSFGVSKPEVGSFDGMRSWKNAPKGLETVWPSPVTTDADGHFQLAGISRGTTIGLQVDDPRYARQWLRIEADAAEGPKRVTLSLRPAFAVSGRVTCADNGEPIRDAIVMIATGAETIYSSGSEYRTDAEGRYTANPPPGKHLLVTVYPPLGSPYLIYGRNLDGNEGLARREVDLSVPRGVLISGTIRARGGRPLSGASVYYDNGGSNVIDKEGTIPGFMSAVPSDADGRYAIAVAPGKGNLLIYGPTADFVHEMKGSRELHSGKAGGERWYADAFVPYEAKPGQQPIAVDVTLKPGATIAGRVVGPDGQAVDEAEIVTTLSISPFHTFWRGDFTIPVRDGRFELHGVPDDVKVKCSFIDAKHGWGVTLDIDAASGAGGPLTVKLERCGTARARIVDKQGQAVENSVLNLHIVASPGPGTNYGGNSLTDEEKSMLDADEEIYANVDRRNYWRAPRSDAQGRLTLPYLIPGATYRIYEYTPDRGEGAYRWHDFTVAPGQDFDLGNVRLKARGE